MASETSANGTTSGPVAKRHSPRPAAKGRANKSASTGTLLLATKQVRRTFPRRTLEDATRIPLALKEKNGGNPWSPDQVASAIGLSKSNPDFFYLAAASRDYGFTEGSRDSSEIALTELGRGFAYAPSADAELKFKRQGFLNVDLFRKVLEYYNGSTLPEMKYLGNTLQDKFDLDPSVHDEFSELFRNNTKYLGIADGSASPASILETKPRLANTKSAAPNDPGVVTLAEPETDTGLLCFVVMPFRERDEGRPRGFFDEVLSQLIAPAGKRAGFKVVTAKRQGSDVIHATIVNSLLSADLVVADLTEHNPNVMFELGMRIALDKPVALIRATGTGPIFDVDNLIRVLDYSPNLWPSTLAVDLPAITKHIEATAANVAKERSYLGILKNASAIAQAHP